MSGEGNTWDFPNTCEICDGPEECWAGKQPCALAGMVHNPESDRWADVSVLLDPCVGTPIAG